jgi:hypothetical protein
MVAWRWSWNSACAARAAVRGRQSASLAPRVACAAVRSRREPVDFLRLAITCVVRWLIASRSLRPLWLHSDSVGNRYRKYTYKIVPSLRGPELFGPREALGAGPLAILNVTAIMKCGT